MEFTPHGDEPGVLPLWEGTFTAAVSDLDLDRATVSSTEMTFGTEYRLTLTCKGEAECFEASGHFIRGGDSPGADENERYLYVICRTQEECQGLLDIMRGKEWRFG